MCGRAALSAPPEDLRELFQLDETPVLVPRYNIAPTQLISIVRAGEPGSGRRIELVRWGLVPFWAEDRRDAAKRINARIESIATTPAFRDAFQRHRCIVVVDAFYEWQARGKVREPYVFRRVDQKPFALAGIWDRWRSKDGEVVETTAVVTTASAGLVTRIHDRMPLLLVPGDYERWIREAPDGLAKSLPTGAPLGDFTAYAVSTRVNSPANDDAACLEPPEQTALF